MRQVSGLTHNQELQEPRVEEGRRPGGRECPTSVPTAALMVPDRQEGATYGVRGVGPAWFRGENQKPLTPTPKAWLGPSLLFSPLKGKVKIKNIVLLRSESSQEAQVTGGGWVQGMCITFFSFCSPETSPHKSEIIKVT